MAKKLTKAQVDRIFREDVMPIIRTKEKEYKRGRCSVDVPMRCEAYNDFVDSLCEDGQLTRYQANTYDIPKSLIGE